MAARSGNLLVLARMASLQFLDINKIDTWGYTPLDHAVDQKEWPCVVLLLSMGGVNSLYAGGLSELVIAYYCKNCLDFLFVTPQV